jgi:hypothetical protein
MISFTSGLGNGFSTEAYYQFRWNSFKFDPAGTYWSAADFLGKGGKRGALLAKRKRMQSYIRHLEWTLVGPCRHGICARSANRYERQT